MDKITAEIRVTSQKIQPFAYKDGLGEMVGGEAMAVRAEGFWEHTEGTVFPVSLHITAPPGHGAIPVLGDCITVTVDRY